MLNEKYKLTPYNESTDLEIDSYKSGRYEYFSYKIFFKSLNIEFKVTLRHPILKVFDYLELMLLSRRFSKSNKLDIVELHTGHNYYEVIGFLLDNRYFYPLIKDEQNGNRHNYFKNISNGDWHTPLDEEEKATLIKEFDEYFIQNKSLSGQLKYYMPFLLLSIFSLFKFFQDNNTLGIINTLLITALIFLALNYLTEHNKNKVATYIEDLTDEELKLFKIHYMCNFKLSYDNPNTYSNKAFIESSDCPFFPTKNELFYRKLIQKTFVVKK